MGKELATAREGKPHYVSTIQTSACAIFVNDPLAKASHVDKPRFKGEELYPLMGGAFNLLYLRFYVRSSLSCWTRNTQNLLAYTLSPFPNIWTIVFVMFWYVSMANCSFYFDCICYLVLQPFCIFRGTGQWVMVLMFKVSSQTWFCFPCFQFFRVLLNLVPNIYNMYYYSHFSDDRIESIDSRGWIWIQI